MFGDKIELKSSALVVKNMATEAQVRTGFHKDNDVYSQMASDRIDINIRKGEYNQVPYSTQYRVII